MVMRMDERFRRCFIISRTGSDNHAIQIELNEININLPTLRREGSNEYVYCTQHLNFNERSKVSKFLYALVVVNIGKSRMPN